jgi:hypothetical protein
MEEVLLDGQRYVSSKRAAKITGYAKDYVGQLCREGKVPAQLVGRGWFVLESAIREHRFGTSTSVHSADAASAAVVEHSAASERARAEKEEEPAVEAHPGDDIHASARAAALAAAATRLQSQVPAPEREPDRAHGYIAPEAIAAEDRAIRMLGHTLDAPTYEPVTAEPLPTINRINRLAAVTELGQASPEQAPELPDDRAPHAEEARIALHAEEERELSSEVEEDPPVPVPVHRAYESDQQAIDTGGEELKLKSDVSYARAGETRTTTAVRATPLAAPRQARPAPPRSARRSRVSAWVSVVVVAVVALGVVTIGMGAVTLGKYAYLVSGLTGTFTYVNSY